MEEATAGSCSLPGEGDKGEAAVLQAAELGGHGPRG